MAVIAQPFRTQILLGVALLLAALYLAVPVHHADIWVLLTWGGFDLPIWVWPALSGLLGLSLILNRQPRQLMGISMLSAVVFITLSGALWLSNGPALGALWSGWLAINAIWAAIDFKNWRPSA